MAFHNTTGNIGEDLASEYLTAKGFTIIEKNWKFGKLEADVIASKDDVLHFIEIKTRTSITYGYPEESVGRRKLKRLIILADAFMKKHPGWTRIEFDILSILLPLNRGPEFFFIKDVYI